MTMESEFTPLLKAYPSVLEVMARSVLQRWESTLGDGFSIRSMDHDRCDNETCRKDTK